jgi:biotin operon repressor
MDLRTRSNAGVDSDHPPQKGHAESGIYKNLLLRRLQPDVVARLNLRRVTFELGHEIEYPGKTIDHLYFGVSALMGTKRSLNRIYTQIGGYGFSCSTEAGRREFALGGMFQDLALRYVQAQLVQAMQSAGCNAKHEVDQRLARWLLLCADRAHSNTFKMSQEYLADMLGSSRPTVTVAAGNLKAKGLIEYTRGTIHIPDSQRLEGVACECYHVIKDHLGSYAEFDTGHVA